MRNRNPASDSPSSEHGIRENAVQFVHQLIQVLLVGSWIVAATLLLGLTGAFAGR